MRKLLIFLLGLLCFGGFMWESFIFFSLNLSAKQWQTLAVAILIFMLAYFVPLVVLVSYFSKKEKLKLSHFWLSVFAGAAGISSLSGILNHWLTNVLKAVISNQSFVSSWGGSIVPPFVEEGLKLLIALVIAYLVRAKKLSAYILIGLGVGLGFQLSEDYTYVIGAFIDKAENPLLQAFLRLETAFASHWLMTAMLCGACCILFVQKSKLKPRLSYLWLVYPLILHVLWNSPWIDNNTVMKVSLTIASWLVFGTLCRYVFFSKSRENLTTDALTKGS
ncbi:PrsW family glutamic-type intramembrane protease [Streptococcus sp. H31]|uniref:PrsW family glutamic-type intramembrane protease n=1 Tax=Streptococcus huangxiaojuni TaxID=3237239 RepID=UPI0034A29DF9